jgi:hypothetical protein
MSKVSEYRQDAKECSLRLETSVGGSGKGWVPPASASRREAPHAGPHEAQAIPSSVGTSTALKAFLGNSSACASVA